MSRSDLGDPRVFASAYREHMPRAVRAAHAVLRNRAAAEDVAQEVFAELWSHPNRFDARRGSLPAYVSMRARCKAIDAHRATRVRDAALARAGAEPQPPAHDVVADSAIRAELRSRILEALDQLPRPQRDALLMTSANGLSVPEVARVSGVPLGTAKSRVRLGLRRSRALLESA